RLGTATTSVSASAGVILTAKAMLSASPPPASCAEAAWEQGRGWRSTVVLALAALISRAGSRTMWWPVAPVSSWPGSEARKKQKRFCRKGRHSGVALFEFGGHATPLKAILVVLREVGVVVN